MSGDSRILFGSEHVIGQALMEGESRMKSLHGEQVALGTIVMSQFQGLDWKRLRRSLEEIGAPTTARAIGFDSEPFVRAVARGPEINRAWMRDRPDFYTVLTHKRFTEQEVRKIAKETGVIE